MKLKALLIGAALGMTLLQMGVAHATKTEKVVKADNKADFSAVNATVHKEMLPGGRYEYATNKEREDVNAHLADMQSLFDKYGTVAQMDDKSKMQLFNDQEAVNATLTHRDNQRLVCESEIPVGSHIPRKTCHTYGEIEQAHRNSMKWMQDQERVPQYKGGN